MKKTLTALVISAFLFIIFGILSSAEDSEVGRFLISENEDGYSLYEYRGGEPNMLACSDIKEIMSYLCGLGGVEVVFDHVTIKEDLELPWGDYVFYGSLTVREDVKITVPEGTSLSLNMEATLERDSYIRIKGGDVKIYGGSVSAINRSAFLLDYSVASNLCIYEGEVISDSEDGAILLKLGSLNLKGGEVRCSGGAAVNSDSVVRLSGKPFLSGASEEIVTDEAVILSCGGEYYEGTDEVRIRYQKDFERGSLTEVIYGANGASVNGIRILSLSGKEYEPTYFEESRYTDEKGFYAVYLPFSVKLFDKGELICEQMKLMGESVDVLDLTSKTGYSFNGWYTDEALTDLFPPDRKITEDTRLYASYSLELPTFSASSVEFTYDGKERELRIDRLYHPLICEGGFFTYKWYKGEELVGNSETLRLKEVADSGQYSCKVTFNYSSDSASVKVEGIEVKINKKLITLPRIAEETYTSKPIYPSVPLSSYYTFEEISYVNAGTYLLELTLTDTENTAWLSSEEAKTSVVFTVRKAENEFIEEISVYDCYLGTAPCISAKVRFGEIKCLYSAKADGEYLETLPASVGKYYVVLSVDESENYASIRSEPLEFNLLSETVSSLTVLGEADKKSYQSFDVFLSTGLLLKAVYNSGREETVEADRIAVSYQNGNSLKYGDTGVVISFLGVSIVYPVEVKKCEYDLTDIILNDISVIYDGVFHAYTCSAETVVGKDGIPLIIKTFGGGCEVGEYTIRIVFESDSKEYLLPEERSLKLTVEQRQVDLVWSEGRFVYDGCVKTPSAYYLDAFGVKRYARVNGGRVNAGEGYIANAVLENSNYYAANTEFRFCVLKADFDLSNLEWSEDSFVYDGEEKQIRLEGLPEGLSVVGYTDNTYTECGEYTVRAALTYDEANYNPPPILTHVWRVLPAEYDMSGCVFTDVSVTYDGKLHFPSINGELPSGIDGSQPSYIYSQGVCHVSEGRCAVKIIFSSESKNYNAPRDAVAYVEILPMGITVEWEESEYVYDGTNKSPTALSPLTSVSVLGGAADAGIYNAVAVSDNSDYYVINESKEFEIKKADNHFVSELEIYDIFESEYPNPFCSAYFGEAEYSFYYDRELTRPAQLPLCQGIYYSVAVIPESRNYNCLSSLPVRFEVKAVYCIGISAELLIEKPIAFYRLTRDDYRVVCRYNDGGEKEVSENEVTVIYENGDSLRKKDTFLSFSVGEFDVRVPISVEYAVYDTGKVRWSNTESVYNGRINEPIISGLPEGVTLISLDGIGKNAGEYKVTPILDYDRDNYRKPILPDCVFTVRKQTVDIPKLVSVRYSGKAYAPISESSLYDFVYSGEIKDAGSYKLVASLKDSLNYEFANGQSSCETEFEILPVIIELSVSDYDLYLFSKIGEIDYRIVNGKAAEGETVSLITKIVNDTIEIICADKNYVLTNNTARINRINRLEPTLAERLLLLSLLLVLLLLAVVTAVVNRNRLFAFYIRFLYRIRNKQTKLTVPILPPVSPIPMLAAPVTDPPRQNDLTDTVGNGETIELPGVDVERADDLITDSLAKDLLKKSREAVYTNGYKREIVNVDTLNESFKAGDRVDVNSLKERGLVSGDTAYIKVLARGEINKSLSVYANDFSLSAIKMIALTGGESVKIVTVTYKNKR